MSERFHVAEMAGNRVERLLSEVHVRLWGSMDLCGRGILSV